MTQSVLVHICVCVGGPLHGEFMAWPHNQREYVGAGSNRGTYFWSPRDNQWHWKVHATSRVNGE